MITKGVVQFFVVCATCPCALCHVGFYFISEMWRYRTAAAQGLGFFRCECCIVRKSKLQHQCAQGRKIAGQRCLCVVSPAVLKNIPNPMKDEKSKVSIASLRWYKHSPACCTARTSLVMVTRYEKLHTHTHTAR
jgi:hypothetical protein